MGGGGRAAVAPSKERVVSRDELAKHRSAADGWVSILGKVYDVSKWDDHPGGRVLLSALGEGDSSDVFKSFHSPKAYAMLQKFYVGELEPAAAMPSAPVASTPADLRPFEVAYRALHTQAVAEGLFKANLGYYLWKFVSTTAIAVAAAGITWHYAAAGSVGGQLLGAVVLAFFWQQCGWLAHDFGHHQVFASRALNDAGILVVGNLYQGFSCEWWKNKHNTHHAIPNTHESAPELHDGDPDIDTLPFLAWSRVMLAKATSPTARALVRWQAVLYFPVLFFARLVWALQSAQFVFRFNVALFDNTEGAQRGKVAAEAGDASGAYRLKYEAAEKGLILAHYAWVAALCFGLTSSLWVGAAHFVVAETLCGLLLAASFGVGHNGMEVFDLRAKPGYAELQVRTTRNVDDDALGLTGWFMGGLHLQIEHHLFIGVPRHNLAKLRPRVEAMCKAHGVPYHSTSLAAGTVEVLSHLQSVSDLADLA